MGAQQAAWLIKSGGTVEGPFTSSHVIEQIRQRKIVPLDEVASPFRRWVYVKDEPMFRDALDETESSLDKTSSATESSTMTLSVTEPMDRSLNDDLTEEVESPFYQEELTAKFETEEEDEPASSRSNETSKGPVYGYAQDRRVQEQAQQRGMLLWALAVATIFVFGATVFYYSRQNRPQIERLSANELFSEAKQSMKIGEYNQALKLLTKFQQGRPKKPEALIYLAALSVQLESETVLARRYLDTLEQSSPGRFLKEIANARGLVELKDGNLIGAKSHFEKAIREAPNYLPPVANLGYVYYQQGLFEKAKNQFEQAIQIDSTRGESHLMLADTLIALWRERQDREYLEEARKKLQTFIEGAYNFAQEASLKRLYVDFLAGRESELETGLLDTLDRDPWLSQLHTQSLMLESSLISWSQLNSQCQQLEGPSTAQAYLLSLKALCHENSGQPVLAKQKIDSALSRDPRDPLIQAVQAYVLRRSGQGDEASVALGRAIESNKTGDYVLPKLLQAKFCQSQRDFDCARKGWTELMTIPRTQLSGFGHVALINARTRLPEEAKRYILKGSRLSESYIPITRARQIVKDLTRKNQMSTTDL